MGIRGRGRMSFAQRIVVVDCFAGPWKSAGDGSSPAILLNALNDAHEFWAPRRLQKGGRAPELVAAFVENDDEAFPRLHRFVAERAGAVSTATLHTTFEAAVPQLQRLMGTDPAFLFVDPTGWKGVGMEAIGALCMHRGRAHQQPPRDVLINVMFDHINRFKDSDLHFIPGQMRAFFGLGDADLASGLSEEALLSLYRRQLKHLGHLDHAADLIVPEPLQDRTKFRLVVGGRHPKTLAVFRDAEHKVCGAIAAQVRADAKARSAPTQQLGLFGTPRPPPRDGNYESLYRGALNGLDNAILASLAPTGTPWEKLWPSLLEARHLRYADRPQCCAAAGEGGPGARGRRGAEPPVQIA